MVAKLDDVLKPAGVDSTSTGVIEEIAREAFNVETPVEFSWFERQQAQHPRTEDVALELVRVNFREAAWALSQLYYDQSLKQSVATRKRNNLAWPAWGMASVGRCIEHTSAARHFSALALIGDILWEPRPDYRGAAIHELTVHWGRIVVEKFDAWCRDCAKGWATDVPIFPEALLAAYWLQDRKQYVLDVAQAQRGVPFVNVLLDEAARTSDTNRAGTLFEAAVALLLSATPGFEVRGSAKDVSSQTDLVLVSKSDRFSGALLPQGYAIAECKFWQKPVSASVVREFGARCLLVDVGLGILVTRNGITGGEIAGAALADAERERSRLLGRGVQILVLSADDLRVRARELRGLQDLLIEDSERLRFGRQS